MLGVVDGSALSGQAAGLKGQTRIEELTHRQLSEMEDRVDLYQQHKPYRDAPE